MQFTVSAVSSNTRTWGDPGKEQMTYTLKGNFAGQTEEIVQINTPVDPAKHKKPAKGEVIDCEIARDDPKYGKTIKRNPKQSAYAPSGARQSDSPEKQSSIERQHALSQAVAHAVAMSQMLYSTDKAEDAFNALSLDVIIENAREFHKYTSGQLEPVTTAAEAKPLAKQAKEVFPDSEFADDTEDIPF